MGGEPDRGLRSTKQVEECPAGLLPERHVLAPGARGRVLPQLRGGELPLLGVRPAWTRNRR